MISPNAEPPVCRIMDYGKYRYDQIKKEKEAKKAQKIINIKEVRMTPNIDTHDLNVKAKQAERFLENGDKVKVSVRFRGRELGHTNLGRVVLEDFLEILGDKAIVDKQPKMEGRNMVMHLNPGTNK
jgi:translation initiation factor IF-3